MPSNRPDGAKRSRNGKSLSGSKEGIRKTNRLEEKREAVRQKNGAESSRFFSAVASGTEQRPIAQYKPVLTLPFAVDSFLQSYQSFADGHFNRHIAASIPAYQEVQVAIGYAISTWLRTSRSPSVFLDIGCSEGELICAVALEATNAKCIGIDPNPAMKAVFQDRGSDIPKNAEFLLNAFGFEGSSQKKGIAWIDPDTEQEILWFAARKNSVDIIHEGMTFQFINPDREQQIQRIKYLLSHAGVFVCEQKFLTYDSEEWMRSERRKDAYKAQYFSAEEIKKKQLEVLEKEAVGMTDNMAFYEDFEDLLTEKFKFVFHYWDSGNFKGYICSDNSMSIRRFMRSLANTHSQFSNFRTPMDISR